MTAFSRPPAEGDAILGVRPGTVFEPSTVEEAVEVVGESGRGGKALAFVGGGTDLELGAPPRRLDAVVRTSRLSRIVEHAPFDQIVVVEAGMTLEALQAALAPHRQRLALDPPLPGRKTVGGIIAANAYGPRRARFGSVRDLIIGISFVRADGTLARGGGKVVKNVAGFDLPKLMVGSLGTLGLITTATFRLHPLPEEEVTLRLPGRTAAGVRSLMRAVKEAQLEPTSVVAAWRQADQFDVAVRFEGFRAGVAEQRERLAGLVRKEPEGACEVLDEGTARAFWSRHDELRAGPPLRAKLTALPTHIEAIARGRSPGHACRARGSRFPLVRLARAGIPRRISGQHRFRGCRDSRRPRARRRPGRHPHAPGRARRDSRARGRLGSAASVSFPHAERQGPARPAGSFVSGPLRRRNLIMIVIGDRRICH